jgi:DNA-binding CsgD family transcriptional regulator
MISDRSQSALGYDHLLASIYRDLAEVPIKTSWIKKLESFFDLDSAVVVLEKMDSRNIRFASGTGAASASIEYPATVHAQNLWLLDPAHHLPARQAITFNSNIFKRERRHRNFFASCLQPFGLSSLLCINIDASGDTRVCIRLGRGADRSDFSATDAQLLEGLSLHLHRALSLSGTAFHARHATASLYQAVNNLRVGVVVFDREKQIVAINRAGSAAMNRIPGIAADNSRLRITDRHKAGAFLGYLDAGFRGAPGDTSGRPFTLAGADDSTPLHFLAKPLRSDAGSAFDPDSGFLALFVGPERELSNSNLQTLMDLFGFSRTEAKVAALLAGGASVDTVADMLFKSRNTIRSHARSIYGKADVENQAQLAALIMSSAANLII